MIPDSREAQWSESDEAVLNSILDMLAADRPEGLNWPGVARLVRKRIRLLSDVLGSPRLQDQKNQEDTRVDRQCDPTDSPTASDVTPLSDDPALRQLSAKWRERADQFNYTEDAAAYTELRRCADQLDAVAR